MGDTGERVWNEAMQDLKTSIKLENVSEDLYCNSHNASGGERQSEMRPNIINPTRVNGAHLSELCKSLTTRKNELASIHRQSTLGPDIKLENIERCDIREVSNQGKLSEPTVSKDSTRGCGGPENRRAYDVVIKCEMFDHAGQNEPSNIRGQDFNRDKKLESVLGGSPNDGGNDTVFNRHLMCEPETKQASRLCNPVQKPDDDSCDDCNERCHSEHASKHRRKENNYLCEYCGKAFEWLVKLRTHIANHEKNTKCHICHKIFSKPRSYRNHVIVHTNAKPYKCKICSKKYRWKRTFTYHLLIHDSKNPFKCLPCGKVYIRSRSLDIHIARFHPEQKLCVCSLCEREFRHQDALNEHFRIRHTGSKPFQCSTCEISYSNGSVLKAHGTKTGHRVCLENYKALLDRDYSPFNFKKF